MAASLVGTSTTHYTIAYSCVRKCFHANGRFWVFYSDGYNMIYKTSTDGATWSGPTIIGACGQGYGFSVWFDGTYLHYVLCYPSDTPTYRRGEPMSDGSITWSAPAQICWQLSGYTSHIPSISVDFAGYPFIAFLRRTVASEEYYFHVTKSSKNDGTWETSPDFPYQIQTVYNATWQDASIVPLTGGKMYVAYNYDNLTMKGRLWDGSSWGDEETASVSNTNVPSCFSVTREGDDVHLVFTDWPNQDVIYVKRTYGVGWGSETVVHVRIAAPLALVENTSGLSIDGNGILYCFWIDSPIDNHIFYKKCVDGVWDTVPTDLGDTGPGSTIYWGMTGYCGAYDGYIGLLYYKYNSVRDVKHDFLSGLTPYIPEPGVYLASSPMEPRTCYEVEGCVGTTVTEFNLGDLIKASAQYFCKGSDPEKWHDFFGETVGVKWYHNDELIAEAEEIIPGHYWNVCAYWETNQLPVGSGYVEFYWQGVYKGRTNDYIVREVAPSDLCIWLGDHGAPNILVTDVFAIINSYLFETPPNGYTFVPNLQNVFGVIDYHFGFNGDAMTGCNFFP